MLNEIFLGDLCCRWSCDHWLASKTF